MPDKDVIRRSVTRSDLPLSVESGIWHLMVPILASSAAPGLLPFWQPGRDWQLYQSIYREAQWANAISKATTKMSGLSFEVEGDVSMRVRRAREILMAFDAGRGWVPGLSKHLQAFLLTGNGAFLEIVHQTGAPGSKVIGLVHLDTFRCVRTGDPDYPVIYRDRQGGEHILKAHQAMMLSDMPDQAELWNGVGHCAAERAWPAIIKQEAIERYVYEKTSGQRPLSIWLANGISPTQLENAIGTAKQDSKAKGLAVYMGAVIVPLVDPKAAATVQEIRLAELPDGFDAEKERKNAYLTYANAIGIDPQMLDPDLLASRALGTGAQARVISEKQEGMGLTAWRKAFEHSLNEMVLDEKTTFAFQERDLGDEQRRAEISRTRADFLNILVTAGVLTTDQALQIGVDWDEIPEEFLPADETPDESLTDEQKPEGEAAPEVPPAEPSAKPGADLLAGLVELNTMGGKAARTLSEALDGYLEKAKAEGRREAAESAGLLALKAAVEGLAEAAEEPAPAPVFSPQIVVEKDKESAILIGQAVEAVKDGVDGMKQAAERMVVAAEKAAVRVSKIELKIKPTPVIVQTEVTMPPFTRETEIVRDASGKAVGAKEKYTQRKETA